VQSVVLIESATVNGFEEVRRDPGRPHLDREASVSIVGDAIGGIVP
jgi:hypothetical protein